MTFEGIHHHCPTLKIVKEVQRPYDAPWYSKLVFGVGPHVRCNRTRKYVQKYVDEHRMRGETIEVEVVHL